METDAEFVTIKLLKLLNIKANQETVFSLLKTHPGFPSLAAINDTLKRIHLDTIPTRLTISDLEELKHPTISHISSPVNSFIIITKFDALNKRVEYLNAEDILNSEDLKAFEEKWSGIVLIANKTKGTGEQNYYLNWIKYNIQLVLLVMVSLFFSIAFFSLQENTLIPSKRILIIPKMLGLGISWLILLKSNLQGTDWASKICRINSLFDCQKVIDSKFGAFFNITSLSELAAFYYTFTVFLFLFSINSIYISEIWTTFLFLNLFGVPIIIYSVYSQMYKIRSWCPLCLSIIILYLIEILILIPKHFKFNISWNYIFSSEVLFSLLMTALTMLLLIQLKTLWRKKSAQLNSQRRWFLDIPGAFELIMNQQQKTTCDLVLKSKIIIGNKESADSIILVINPTCLHCESIALQLNKLLLSHPNFINIDLRFYLTSDISKYIIAIFIENGGIKGWEAYLFYAQFGFDALKKQYPLRKETFNEAEYVYNDHMNWCASVGITGTPKLYINKKEVPGVVQDEDNLIKYVEGYFLNKNELKTSPN